jgi:hypothetical protein
MSDSSEVEGNVVVTQDCNYGVSTKSNALTEAYYVQLESSSPQVVIAMTIGHSSFARSKGGGWPDFDSGLWKDYSKWYSTLNVTVEYLKNEVSRRYSDYFKKDKSMLQPKPNAWKKAKVYEWLIQHPIPINLQEKELEFVDKQVAKLEVFIESEISKADRLNNDSIQQWSYKNPVNWLRLYHAVIDDNVKESLAREMQVMTRLELDGRQAGRGTTFFQRLANKFNDVDWIPSSIVMPHVHEDFSESVELPLQCKFITADECRQRFVKARSKLHIMQKHWLMSGSGRGMVDGKSSEEEIYNFIDGDDRQQFVVDNWTHVLYLWQIGYDHQILNDISQTLHDSVTAEGNRVACVASSPIRKKQKVSGKSSLNVQDGRFTLEEMDQSYESSLSHINDITTIQALLESKQRELAVVCKQLGKATESKYQYELLLCGAVPNNQDLLKRAVDEYTAKVISYEIEENKLKTEVLELQVRLKENISSNIGMQRRTEDIELSNTDNDDNSSL